MPHIIGRGMASKRARKGRKIKILPNSGATMTLCHSKVANGLGLKISKKDRDTYELVDAQGCQMKVAGTCVIHVVPDGCEAPRTLKCLVTLSLEDEEILLGWSDMVRWGILRENFNKLSDDIESACMGDKERVLRSAVPSVPSSVSADSVGPQGSVRDIDQQLRELKEEVLGN